MHETFEMLPRVKSAVLLLILLVVITAAVTLDQSTAHAAHPYFLAVTIDDPLTVKSVCRSEKQISAQVGSLVQPYIPSDLHVSLLVFAGDLNHLKSSGLHKTVQGAVDGLDKYGEIKLAHVTKGGSYKVFSNPKNPPGHLVFSFEDPGIFKTIANRLQAAIEKANTKAGPAKTIEITRNDFSDDLKHTNGHMSFANFDLDSTIGGKKLSTFLEQTFQASNAKGQFNINSPDATTDWVLYEIDLKHKENNHYVNVDRWILPNPGKSHPTPPAKCP
jgi:hypothetical protein